MAPSLLPRGGGTLDSIDSSKISKYIDFLSRIRELKILELMRRREFCYSRSIGNSRD
jgi:hypothetical protein